METGEGSGTKPRSDIWAKLVPSLSGCPEVEISSKETVICSKITLASEAKHNWCRITKNLDQSYAILQNLSSKVIIVDGNFIEKEESRTIKSGSEIVSGPDKNDHLSYCFKILPNEESNKDELKVDKCDSHVSIDVEHTKCSICLNVWHDVVTVAPCFHNFCNGCFSEWLRRLRRKHQTIACPQCRATVHAVGRNHFLRNIEEDIRKKIPSLRRSSEEEQLIDAYASIDSYLVMKVGKLTPKKRAASPSITEGFTRSCCPQCVSTIGGFKCNPVTTAHMQCRACEGMMPSRPEITVPQQCMGCDRAFCGAYWQSQNLTASMSFQICRDASFVPVSHRSISRLPNSIHQNNLYEQEITNNCIQQAGKTLQDVISDWISKLDNQEIDRTRMPLNHSEMITSETHLCNDCYEKLIGYLLYWFRVTLPPSLLPREASRRADCWYGYDCRTQHHNVEHAKKRNHVCRPSRGNSR